MRYAGQSLLAAVRAVVVDELPRMGGEGGVIAIDREGHIALEFNSEGMFRGSQRAGETAEIAIYR
jgi:beta-aspartyl-peptidase (threonine type)